MSKLSHTLDAQIETMESTLTALRKQRSADIRAAHTFTAADYRIVIITDDSGGGTIDDIIGEPAALNDSPETHAYQARLQAIFDDKSREEIWVYGVVVEERNPETGEFDEISSVWGFYYLSYDSWDEFERDQLLDAAADMLPAGIDIKLVEIVRDRN